MVSAHFCPRWTDFTPFLTVYRIIIILIISYMLKMGVIFDHLAKSGQKRAFFVRTKIVFRSNFKFS